VTNEGRGWHLHIHCLVDADWVDGKLLAVEWASVTSGQGFIVKVKDARDKDYLAEVSKYVVKGSQLSSWSGEDIGSFIDSFTGNRTFGVFGSLYAKRGEYKDYLDSITESKASCKCGCDKFLYFTDDELEVFHIETDQKRHSPEFGQTRIINWADSSLQMNFGFAPIPTRASNYSSGA